MEWGELGPLGVVWLVREEGEGTFRLGLRCRNVVLNNIHNLWLRFVRGGGGMGSRSTSSSAVAGGRVRGLGVLGLLGSLGS